MTSLFGHQAEFAGTLPEGYTLECAELLAAELPSEDTNEKKYEAINNWILGEYTIILYYNGEEVKKISITKLIPETLIQ